MRVDVARWLGHRTYTATDYRAVALVAAKRAQGRTVSVVLPALDEERTVGVIVSAIRRELVERHPLVDELVVVDDGVGILILHYRNDQLHGSSFQDLSRVLRLDPIIGLCRKSGQRWRSM